MSSHARFRVAFTLVVMRISRCTGVRVARKFSCGIQDVRALANECASPFLACLFRATHACFMRVVKKLARVLILRYYAFQTQI